MHDRDADAELAAAADALATGDAGADDRYGRALDRWLSLGGADLHARIGEVWHELALGDRLLGQTTATLSGPGPLLALTACGVAVALWAPPRRAVLLGASTPVALFVAHQAVPAGTVSDVVARWQSDPWWVLAGAILVCVAGRHR